MLTVDPEPAEWVGALATSESSRRPHPHALLLLAWREDRRVGSKIQNCQVTPFYLENRWTAPCSGHHRTTVSPHARAGPVTSA